MLHLGSLKNEFSRLAKGGRDSWKGESKLSSILGENPGKSCLCSSSSPNLLTDRHFVKSTWSLRFGFSIFWKISLKSELGRLVVVHLFGICSDSAVNAFSVEKKYSYADSLGHLSALDLGIH
jgi:hypothetical protein